MLASIDVKFIFDRAHLWLFSTFDVVDSLNAKFFQIWSSVAG